MATDTQFYAEVKYKAYKNPDFKEEDFSSAPYLLDYTINVNGRETTGQAQLGYIDPDQIQEELRVRALNEATDEPFEGAFSVVGPGAKVLPIVEAR